MSTKRSLGFSLVEILVALLISMLLMAGVLTIMSSSKRTYALQDELAKLQENARFVMDDVTFALRMAGYSGCSNIRGGASSFEGSSKASIPLRVAKKDAQYGYKLTTAFSSKPVTSDTLQVTYYANQLKLDLDEDGIAHDVETPATEIEKVLDANAATLSLHKDSMKPSVNEDVVISDCGGAETYEITNVNTSSPNYTKVKIKRNTTGETRLGRDYRAPIEIFATAVPTQYQVGAIDKNNDEDVTDAEDGFALFRNGLFFIEGVQRLKIRYGLDKNGDKVADVYATDYAGGGAVVSVRISVLMRTANRRFDLGEGNEKVADASLVYKPEDGFRYRSFTSTVKIRNN